MPSQQWSQKSIAVSAESAAVRNGVSEMVADIVEGFAAGKDLLRSHLDAYEEIIPHVFFGDLSGHVLDCPSGSSRQAVLISVSRAVEKALDTSGSVDDGGEWMLYLENLLFVSWFESIEVEPEILTAFLAESGPLVKQQHAAYVKASELYWRIYSDPSMTRERAAQVVLQADRETDSDRAPQENADEAPVN